ncbi:glycosyltransferase family 4 protein [Caldicellulosiruptoraceae bacterium PP1]
MKIGIDGRAAKWYRGSGIGTYTYQLINNLAHLSNEHEYLIIWPEESSNETILAKNINFNYMSQQLDKFWEQIMIKEIIIQNDIDIYHVPQNGIGIPLSKKCTYIITLHDIIPFRMPETVGPGYLQIFRDYVPKIMKIVDAVITVSEFSKKDICEFFDYDENKVFVTYLAPEEVYKHIDIDKCRVLLKNKFNIDFPYILYLGGFSPRKNIKLLIQAFNFIRKKYKDLHLVIPGKLTRNYEELFNLINSYGIQDYVHFLSYVEVDYLPYLYSGSEVFVYPSLYEGFGLPPLEAMACKCPVITSNVTSMPEILKDAAIYINPYSLEDLIDKLDKVLSDNTIRSSYSEKGYEYSKNFTWQKTVSETIDIYNKIFALKN